MKVKTKYGELNITEDDYGAVSIVYNSDYEILIESRSTNSLKLHVVKPRSNRILTKSNLEQNEIKEVN